MSEEEKIKWLDEAKLLMQQTESTEQSMAALRPEVHGHITSHLFSSFPFLIDAMEPQDILLLGERIHRHLYVLTQELTNFAYAVQRNA